MKTARLKILTCLLAVFTLCMSGSIAFAWFAASPKSLSPDVEGGLVEEYFHCGTGTKDDPFVITRPIHYMHMVEFFQRVTELDVGSTEKAKFGKDYLYFQIGCSETKLYDKTATDSADNTSYYVFDYDDNGDIQYDTSDGTSKAKKSTTLNMQCFSGEKALMPLGTSEIPFLGSLNGDGLTVSNLNIVAKSTVYVKSTTSETVEMVETTRQTCDIGIFGYISDEASITKLYFDGVTLDLCDLSSADTATSQTDKSHSAHTEMRVGYLAGHAYVSDVIQNVYINNCSVKGGQTAQSDWGLFGLVTNTDGTTVGSLSEYINSEGDGQNFGDTIDITDLNAMIENAYNSSSQWTDSNSNFIDDNGEKIYKYWLSDDASYYISSVDGGSGKKYWHLYGSLQTKTESTSGDTKLEPNTIAAYTLSYKHQSTTYYLTANVTKPLGTIESSDALTWYLVKDTNSNYYLYTYINGTAYYLYNNNGSSPTVSQDNKSIVVFDTKDSDGLPSTSSNIKVGDKYLYAGWKQNLYYQSSANTSFSISKTDITITQTNKVGYNIDVDESQRSTQTYIPISSDKTKNTGYFASGVSTEGAGIRIGKFSDISGSVHTVDDSGDHNISDATENDANYQNVKNKSSIMSGSGYGLHFMRASVDINNLYRAKTAYLLGEEYTDYQMTANSVYFYVNEGGSIRFLAGTCYTGNTGFFALYHIERFGNDISSVKEISKIYSKGSTYYYAYSGEIDSYSGVAGYTLAFDCSWITTPGSLIDNAFYYFAIPVNSGYYALGSRSDITGAYLFYLDLGANAGSGKTSINTVQKTFENVDFRSKGQDITASYAMFQMEFTSINSTDFSIKVEYTENVTDGANTYDGVYTVYVQMPSADTSGFKLTAYLFDDGDNSTTHKYRIAYRYDESSWLYLDDGKYYDGKASYQLPSQSI